MYDLERLHHFVTVSEIGSFVRAAEYLGMSQPALTRSLQAFERTHKIRLLNRSRSGVTLTGAGEALLQDAKELLRGARTLGHNIRLLSDAKTGRVAFGIGPLMATLLVPELGSQILREHPGIELDVSIGNVLDLVKRVQSGELEFCCCAQEGVPEIEPLDKIRIGDVRIGPYVRYGHPLLRGKGRPSDYPLISGSSDGPDSQHIPRLVCTDYNIAKQITMTSDAVLLTARKAVTKELKANLLGELLSDVDKLTSNLHIILIRRRGRIPTPAAQKAMDKLRKLARLL
jgi:DNA-binding transcriptional LysR family regulator